MNYRRILRTILTVFYLHNAKFCLYFNILEETYPTKAVYFSSLIQLIASEGAKFVPYYNLPISINRNQ